MNNVWKMWGQLPSMANVGSAIKSGAGVGANYVTEKATNVAKAAWGGGVDIAANKLASLAVANFDYVRQKNEICEELKSLQCDDQVTAMVEFAGDQIFQKIQASLDRLENPHLRSMLQNKATIIKQVLHLNLLICARNIVKKIRSGEGYPADKQVGGAEILAFLVKEIKAKFPGFESKIMAYRALNEGERKAALKVYLTPVVAEFVSLLFPGGSGDFVGLVGPVRDRLFSWVTGTLAIDYAVDFFDNCFIKNANSTDRTHLKQKQRIAKALSLEGEEDAAGKKPLVEAIDESSSLLAHFIRNKLATLVKKMAVDAQGETKALPKCQKVVQLLVGDDQYKSSLGKALDALETKIKKTYIKHGVHTNVNGDFVETIDGRMIPWSQCNEEITREKTYRKLQDAKEKIADLQQDDIETFIRKDLVEILQSLRATYLKGEIEGTFLRDISLFSTLAKETQTTSAASAETVAKEVLSSDSEAFSFVWDKVEAQLRVLLLKVYAHRLENQDPTFSPGDKSLFVADFVHTLMGLVRDKGKGLDKQLQEINSSKLESKEKIERKRALFAPIAAELFSGLSGIDLEVDLPAQDLLKNYGVDGILKELFGQIKQEILPDYLSEQYEKMCSWKVQKEQFQQQLKARFGTNYANEACRVLSKYTEDYLKHWLQNPESAKVFYEQIGTLLKGSPAEAFYKKNDKAILEFINNNDRTLVENCDWPEQKLIFEFFNDYVQCLLLRTFVQMTESMEKVDPDQLLLEALPVFSKHLGAMNEIRKTEGKSYCFEVPSEVMRKGFGDNLHPGIKEPESDREAFVQKFLDAASVQEESFPFFDALKESVYQKLLPQLLSTLFEKIFLQLNDPRNKDRMLLKVLQNLNDTLEGKGATDEDLALTFTKDLMKDLNLSPEDQKKVASWISDFYAIEADDEWREQKKLRLIDCIKTCCGGQKEDEINKFIEEVEKQQKINKEVGDFVIEMVDLLPNSMSATVLNTFKSVHKNLSIALGGSVRAYLHKEGLLKILDEGIKNGVSAFADGTFVGDPGGEAFTPNDDNPLQFDFSNVDQSARNRAWEKDKKEFVKLFTGLLRREFEKRFNNYCWGKYDSANEKLDSWIKENFTLGGIIPAAKWILKTSLDYVVVTVLIKAFWIVFNPIYQLAWLVFTQLYLKKQAKNALKIAEMDTHENGWLKMRDLIINLLHIEKAAAASEKIEGNL